MHPELRKKLYARSLGYCDLCGLPMDEKSMAAHHRKLRGQGGEDRIENLLALHHECHNGTTDSVHLSVAEARKFGWIVPSHASPRTTPFLLHRRKAAVLDDYGGISTTTYCFDCGRHWCACDKEDR